MISSLTIRTRLKPPADPTGDLLATIQERGVLRVSTDKDYAPQSFLEPDGTFVGFDIDVATKIAEGLGVDVEFQHVDWDVITAGSWAERWDISVGSMTITTPRKPFMSFTPALLLHPGIHGREYPLRDHQPGSASLLGARRSGGHDAHRPTQTASRQIAAGRPEFDLLITSETVIDEAVVTTSRS